MADLEERPKRQIKQPSSVIIVQDNEDSKTHTASHIFEEHDPPGERLHRRPVPPATKIYTTDVAFEMQERAVVNIETQEDLQPISHPNLAIRETLDSIRNIDWDNQCEILLNIRRLLKYHPDVVSRYLKPVTEQLLKETISRRQRVARLAITAIGELVTSLPRHMNKVLARIYDVLVTTYTKKNLEIIRKDIEKALDHIMSCDDRGDIPPARILSLALHGPLEKPGARKLASGMILEAIPRIGANRVLIKGKELSRLFDILWMFITKGPDQALINTRQIIGYLMQHPNYFTILERNVIGLRAQTKLRNLTEFSEDVKERIMS